jgi:hypothetical protein
VHGQLEAVATLPSTGEEKEFKKKFDTSLDSLWRASFVISQTTCSANLTLTLHLLEVGPLCRIHPQLITTLVVLPLRLVPNNVPRLLAPNNVPRLPTIIKIKINDRLWVDQAIDGPIPVNPILDPTQTLRRGL